MLSPKSPWELVGSWYGANPQQLESALGIAGRRFGSITISEYRIIISGGTMDLGLMQAGGLDE